jgi:hypothetical protein
LAAQRAEQIDRTPARVAVAFGWLTASLVVAGTVALLCGCASSQAAPRPDLLAFLDGERVTREDVTTRLGPPSGTFARDGVVTYRLGQNKAGYFVVPSPSGYSPVDWRGVDYDLVLAFDDAGILSAHNLVAVRSAPAAR